MNKFQIFQRLCDHLGPRDAAIWLGEPNKELKGGYPADYIKSGNIEPLIKIINKKFPCSRKGK